jgi:purine-binding chemotaxis protein CheW
MDLAKIRQKARQELADRLREETPSNEMEVGESIRVSKGALWNPPAVVEDLLQDLFPVIDSMPLPAVLPEYTATPARRPLQRDPLQIMLAGRVAAGCDEDQPLAAGQVETVVDEYQEFLCFRVSEEIYGINIMDIKEIIKPREVTEVPRAPSFVSGIISLRGIIIPIIDMLDRLGLPREKISGRERVIVVRHGESFSGLLVDEIIQVVRIAKDSLEAAPAVLEGIDRDFVSGIGRADGRMIILLNLENIADIHLY